VSECDPQLPILLRILYEKAQQTEQESAGSLKGTPPNGSDSPSRKKNSGKISYAMLELGIAQSLCVGIQSAVKEASLAASMHTEVMTSLIELLHR
jgi:hypothetical protein